MTLCSAVVSCRCTSTDSLRHFSLTTTVYDITWDLFAYAGYSTASELGGGAIVVAFRGTDSHSLYNWVENMRYWKTDYDIPYPGSEGALVHTGDVSRYHMHTCMHTLHSEHSHAGNAHALLCLQHLPRSVTCKLHLALRSCWLLMSIMHHEVLRPCQSATLEVCFQALW